MDDTAHAESNSSELSVCLFCGSSNEADAKRLEEAAAFGRSLARDGVRLVYGGGGVGLMGAAAKAAHSAGGQVLGVMPKFLRRRELIYDEVPTVLTENMHERKRVMFEQSNAFAVFPGGIGTLEEVVELLSWRRLDLHHKPIVFLNSEGFWDPLFALIAHTVDQRLTPAWLTLTWGVVEDPKDVLPAVRAMLNSAPPGPASGDQAPARF